MNTLSQITSVAAMNLRSVPQRLGTSLVIVIGSGGVVAVLVAVLAMLAGMATTLQSAGRDDRVIVLRNGSASESGSALSRDAAQIIMNAPGIKLATDGKPIVSAEPMRLLKLTTRSDASEVTVPLRGVSQGVADLRPEVKIIAGRMFRPGVNEVIVGQAATTQYRGTNIGDTIATRTAKWTVVGIFSSGGDAHESEVMANADTVMSSDNGSTYGSVTVLLNSTAALQEFSDSLSSNPALRVDVIREREYYARQSKTVSGLLFTLIYVVGSIMTVGALFGALNTMYSAVSTRAREIATLRALGFGSSAIVTSVLVESLLLATAGGLVGAFVAWLFFSGHTVSTTQGSANSQLIFNIAVTPTLAIIGIAISVAIGFAGGLLPALRAARLPVATALREV
jgi:putative ABC transport system permease protein